MKKNNNGLILASQEGRIEVVKSLLANGANINDKNKNGSTALILARKENRKEIVAFLENAERELTERKRKADKEKKERNRKEIENLFRSGERKLKERNYDDAVAFFEKALDLDTEIAAHFQTKSRLTLARQKQQELKELKEWLHVNDLSVAFDSLKEIGVEKMKDLIVIKESDIENFSIKPVQKRQLNLEIMKLKGNTSSSVSPSNTGTCSDSSKHIIPPSQLNGSILTLEEVIGKGGFGTVYRGEYLGTPVAAKKIFQTSSTRKLLSCKHYTIRILCFSLEQSQNEKTYVLSPNIVCVGVSLIIFIAKR